MDSENPPLGEIVTVRAPNKAAPESIVTVDMYVSNAGSDGTLFWILMDKDTGQTLTDVNGEFFYRRAQIGGNRGMRVVGTFIMPGKKWNLVAQCGHDVGGLDLIDNVYTFSVEAI